MPYSSFDAIFSLSMITCLKFYFQNISIVLKKKLPTYKTLFRYLSYQYLSYLF